MVHFKMINFISVFKKQGAAEYIKLNDLHDLGKGSYFLVDLVLCLATEWNIIVKT